MESRIRGDFAAFLEPRFERKCVPQGRCRIRILARGLVPEIAGALRLPGCTLDEAADEGEGAVYLLNCLPEHAGWTEQTEAELTRRFHAWRAGFTLRLDSVECRSARCRLLFGFAHPRDAERLRGEDTPALSYASDHGVALSGFEPVPGGAFGMTMVIERASGGWSSQKSTFEYQFERERRRTLLRKQPRDEAWAASTEQRLRARYEALRGKDVVKEVECRTSMCQVVLLGGQGRRLPRDFTDECRPMSSSGDWDVAAGSLEVLMLECRR